MASHLTLEEQEAVAHRQANCKVWESPKMGGWNAPT